MGNSMSYSYSGREWSLSGLSDYEILTESIKGTIYGNCVGDAIGLLTEFMTKEEAKLYYQKQLKANKILCYEDKVQDFHRARWVEGDWTDDSDQMLLIMKSIMDNEGRAVPTDYAKRLYGWMKHGMPEFNDGGGLGIGRTTLKVLRHPDFMEHPHRVAYDVWDANGRNLAPNGGVMRTSILGTVSFKNIDEVIENATKICKVTHADKRCVASCVAVCVAVALMLQRNPAHLSKNGSINHQRVINDAYSYAVKEVEEENHISDLQYYMLKATSVRDLKLSEAEKIGYTYKTMGAGFWALRQSNFQEAIHAVIMEGGDADTNAAVAGALLGCKLGVSSIPQTWLDGLKYKEWLDTQVNSFLEFLRETGTCPHEAAEQNDEQSADANSCNEGKPEVKDVTIKIVDKEPVDTENSHMEHTEEAFPEADVKANDSAEPSLVKDHNAKSLNAENDNSAHANTEDVEVVNNDSDSTAPKNVSEN